jgi:hypothetical protein
MVTLQSLDESKIILSNIDSVIYDIELSKLKSFKNEMKTSLKYCQITKTYFKYFKSIYSSSVWMDRPLMRLPLANIDKIIIGNCGVDKLKQMNIKIIIQIFAKFDESKFITKKRFSI